MELDEHCLKILASLAAGDVSLSYARMEMNKHGDELLANVLENGFTASASAKDWVGVIGSSNNKS